MFVENAKPLPGQVRTEYIDRVQPGLVLRVSATSQSYVFLWQDGNVRRRMVLDVRPDQGEKLRPGDDDGLSLREARKMAKALRHKLDMIEGFDPTAPDENARTFNWLAQ